MLWIIEVWNFGLISLVGFSGVQNTVVYETSQQLMEKLAVDALQVAMVSVTYHSDLFFPFTKVNLYCKIRIIIVLKTMFCC